MRIVAGELRGRQLKSPDLGRAAADVRSAARDAVQHPRAVGARARACSTATPGRARSASRRSAAARPHVTFVEQRSAGGETDRGEPGACWRARSETCYHPRRIGGRGRAARRAGIRFDHPRSAVRGYRRGGRARRRAARWRRRGDARRRRTRERATRRRPSTRRLRLTRTVKAGDSALSFYER